MAESVDALVSNTCGRKAVPVRPRLWVLRKSFRKSEAFFILGVWHLFISYILKNSIDFISEAARTFHIDLTNI